MTRCERKKKSYTPKQAIWRRTAHEIFRPSMHRRAIDTLLAAAQSGPNIASTRAINIDHRPMQKWNNRSPIGQLSGASCVPMAISPIPIRIRCAESIPGDVDDARIRWPPSERASQPKSQWHNHGAGFIIWLAFFDATR